jgi:glycerol-3-phosphate dehydrogenase
VSRKIGDKATKKFTRNCTTRNRPKCGKYDKALKRLDAFKEERDRLLQLSLDNYDNEYKMPVGSVIKKQLIKKYGVHADKCFRNLFKLKRWQEQNKNGKVRWINTYAIKLEMITVAEDLLAGKELELASLKERVKVYKGEKK